MKLLEMFKKLTKREQEIVSTDFVDIKVNGKYLSITPDTILRFYEELSREERKLKRIKRLAKDAIVINLNL